MWRGGRQLMPLLASIRRGVPASFSGARRPTEAVSGAVATAAPFPRRAASLGWRRYGSAGVSEQPEAEGGVGGAPPPGDSQEEENRTGLETLGPPDPSPSRFNFEEIVSLLRQENAKDICAIQLPPEMKYSDYFIIVSGSSSRHLHAMALYLLKMYKHLKTDCQPHVVIEGKDTDDWLCIDFGHTVIHFMLPETREVYELEKLWTLRSYDDQLAQMLPESLPDNFIFGMPSEQEGLAST